MKILYYNWNEFTGEDCRAVMKEMGHKAISFSYKWNKLGKDPGFEEALLQELSYPSDGLESYDMAFSFNFFPVVSTACQKMGIPYIAWIFDSPHLPLTSETVKNEVNRIWIFDYALYEQMKQENISTVFYSPLGVNGKRLLAQTTPLDDVRIYEHDVCFLGSLYDNEFNFYDKAAGYFPEKLRGYLEGLFSAQQQVFGIDMLGNQEILPPEMIREINQYMKFQLSGSYDMNLDSVIRDILRKKVTQAERRMLLERFGRYFKVDLYTQEYSPVVENVYDLGRADYMRKMPQIFHRSKINLNFTMRSIKTGIPLRALDIMGAGGFLLTGYQAELDEYFVNGRDLVMADSPADMQQKISYYLGHEKEREQIAGNGQKKTIENFDYRKMLHQIFVKSCNF